jgi:peptidoglycan hydrolase CwlO-like protein
MKKYTFQFVFIAMFSLGGCASNSSVFSGHADVPQHNQQSTQSEGNVVSTNSSDAGMTVRDTVETVQDITQTAREAKSTVYEVRRTLNELKGLMEGW